jgi:hypothetical protein
MPKGYEIKVEDGKGNEKKYFSSKANSHKEGSKLASALITHFSANYTAYKPFSTRTVQPGDGGVGFTDISRVAVATITWP